ncbi:MAG: hypothetical protein HOK61_01825 [Alphaproteobacteria bacterium]|nr:hypothetical protein [Alphaproteobacteria bacterium]
MAMRNSPSAKEISRFTDRYFVKTRSAVGRFGDKQVTYAIFMRRPVCFAPRLMMDWLADVAAERDVEFEFETRFEEGDWVGAGEPLLYISGSFHALVDLENW